jgi:hypothetical protein
VARAVLRGFVFFLLADLVFLQHGRLPTLDGYSLRFALFVATMAATILLFFWLPKSDRGPFLSPLKGWIGITILLLGTLVPLWGAIRGLMSGYPLGDILNDANGHIFYWAAIPMALSLNPEDKGWILRVLQRIVAIFCVLCLVVYLASVSSFDCSNFVEKFLRTHDLGFLNEFTDDRPYRLFLKSYILVFVVCAMSAFRLVSRCGSRWDWWAFCLTAAVLWNSYTRSIWALVPVVGVVLALLHWRGRYLKFLLPLLALLLVLLLGLLVSKAGSRFRLDDRDGTAALRWEQAKTLASSFIEHPVCGAGFGSPVDSKTGFSIELDLLNLLRKIGLAGLAMYLLAFLLPVRIAWQQWSNADRCPEAVAFLAIALVAVFGMGAVNPYATASLGIGVLCIAFAQLAFASSDSSFSCLLVSTSRKE